MKTTLLATVLVAALATTVVASMAQPALSDLPSTNRLPGVDLAEGISQITGVAISPMLGVSAIGAWRYYHTPESTRSRLPWFCHPVVWSFGFFLLSLCFLKDVFGTIAPPFVKKPLDMAELFENKVSALVASAAFVPFIASQMARHLGSGEQVSQAPVSQLQYASVLPVSFGSSTVGIQLILLPLCVAAFLVVWLTAHAINVLIALCPFGFIDAILKLVKTFLLSCVVVSYIINPYFGAVVSLLIIGVAALLAPSTFRLTMFGTLLATDTIFRRRAVQHARPERPHAFLARRISNVPVRTFGHLSRGAGGIIRFHYRRWLVLAPRVIDLPSDAIAISKGAFFPSLLHSGDGATFETLIVFPPRYRGQEAAIGTNLDIPDIRDGTLIKGFRAVRAWFTNTISLGKARYAATERG